ncbi:phosphatase PAP2 family protein [Ideonella sp. DXS29W]|uniref:Phosphatase PAP2 family protein n=1 Tax=Ideonella lacteola TaxID=2984193 RepID=A0ABU9BHK8_9BURK
MPRWLDSGWHYSAALDARWALALHQHVDQPALRRLMVWCSRFGDGHLWGALLLVLPLAGGAAGWRCASLLASVGAVNLAIYWTIKAWTRRSRPCAQCPGIRACAPIPDVFSFPSGHSLHAAAFALLLSAYYPALAPLLWFYALLVAMARVVLGLHYPSDVLMGGLIGIATASLALYGWGN